MIVLSTCISIFLPTSRCDAQEFFRPQGPGAARLTVRVHEMATGVRNPAAGEYKLDSVPDGIVSVPPQCVGAHRCPLFVFLPAGVPAREITDWVRPVADKYGMILLTTIPFQPALLDAALKETLRRFAVDPDKLAIIGRCGSGPAGLRYGLENPDVFSRLAVISGLVPDATGLAFQGPSRSQVLLDQGILELHEGSLTELNGTALFETARQLRQAGAPVTVSLSLRGHEHQREDYDFLGHWLQESWGLPAPTPRPVPAVVVDTFSLLTSKALGQLTAFWKSFLAEPDSIGNRARLAHLHEVVLRVGQESLSVWLTDLPALAAQYPSVAADLQRAGLTAAQHDALRTALIAARIAEEAATAIGSIAANTVLAQNVEFLKTHPDELRALNAPQTVRALTGPALRNGSDGDPVGMWRSP